MSNEQIRELLDMIMAVPKSDNFSINFEYHGDSRDISVFVHGKKRCECCGRLEDVSAFKVSDQYDVIKEFINEWKEKIENE